MEYKILTKYLTKPLITLNSMTLKPLTFIFCLPAFAVPVMTTPVKALVLLGGFFVLDFITGILASWVEFRKTLPLVPGSGKRYVIQSEKLRLSVVKFICYGLAPLIAKGLEWAFGIGEFEPHANMQKMTLTTIVIAFCCLIEAYSILFENIKRMGFDIIQNIKKISKVVWGLIKTVKNEKDESAESN